MNYPTWDVTGGQKEKRQAISKIHTSLGHPSPRVMARILREGGANKDVVRMAMEWECPHCAAEKRPRLNRVGKPELARTFNDQVSMDLVWVPKVYGEGADKVEKKVVCLNMIDRATSFQLVVPTPKQDPKAVWNVFMQHWVFHYGAPNRIVVDGGGEFKGEFPESAQRLGIVVWRTAAENPHQNGHAERHGGLFKETLRKTLRECKPVNYEEYKFAYIQALVAKNSLGMCGRSSPYQLVMGQIPRVVGSATDDEYWRSLGLWSEELNGDAVAQRRSDIVNAARTALVKMAARRKVKEALHRKHRGGEVQWKTGDQVLVWRRQKRRGVFDKKATWQGPGVVLATEGRSGMWVSIAGTLIKTSPEKCRGVGEAERLRQWEVEKWI